MKLATVVFLRKDGKIILAKKKGHIHVGEEKLDKSKETYNGYGGKKEETDETIEDTAIRELCEESGGVEGKKEDLIKIGEVQFFWPGNESEEANMFVYFYILEKYSGEPVETDEMYAPEAFILSDIPYDQMMGADKVIVPKMFEMKENIFKAKVRHFENSEYQILEI